MATAKNPPTGGDPLISIEPIAVNDVTAASLLQISTSTLHRLKAQGLLPKPRQIGGTARWLVRELREAAEAAPVSELLPPPRTRSTHSPNGDR